MNLAALKFPVLEIATIVIALGGALFGKASGWAEPSVYTFLVAAGVVYCVLDAMVESCQEFGFDAKGLQSPAGRGLALPWPEIDQVELSQLDRERWWRIWSAVDAPAPRLHMIDDTCVNRWRLRRALRRHLADFDDQTLSGTWRTARAHGRDGEWEVFRSMRGSHMTTSKTLHAEEHVPK
jgi:hypothetical protein